MRIIDRQQLDKAIEAACEHYQHSAPTVADWLDDLYIRLGEQPDSVALVEVFAVERLWDGDEWQQPNYAANAVYKLQERLGRETVGQAGF